MAWVSARSFATSTYTRKLARLKTGPLLKDMLARFDKKLKNKLHPNRSLYIYSGHDSTVASLLNTLKLFEYHNPPYTACVMIELRRINKTGYVSIFYKNTTAEPQPMYIPNCGTSCPLKTMRELYNDVIPDDWETECKMSMLSMTYEDANLQPALVVILCVALSILLVLMLLSCINSYRRRDYQDAKWYLHINS